MNDEGNNAETTKIAKVLIVEDEGPLAKAVDLKLSHAGFQVFRAADGNEAIQMLSEHGAEIDIVLLDLLLPNMDGFGVLESIKDKNYKAKIIVTSNLSQQEDREKALQLGADDYLVKSDIQLSDLVTYLTRFTANEPEPSQ